MAIPFGGLTAAFPGNIALVSFLAAIFGSGNVKSTTHSFGSTSSLDPAGSSCNFVALPDMRSAWSNTEDPCGQKLPFEFWIYMKAEGTANNSDANHVRMECLKPRDVGLVELTTPENWNSTTLSAAPGELLHETKRSASYLVRSPLDFQAMCSDDQVAKVSRVGPFVETSAFPRRKSKRRLKNIVGEAGTAHEDISGFGGAFDDQEIGSVASYSSRGPSSVNSASGIETRLKPVATAATGPQTSTGHFSFFDGMSAAAPVAASIATIVRDACYPRVVTYDDMIEMLTDYRYTTDVTSDAGGEIEMWGAEAGYGIISANQTLGWIVTNCQESCSGSQLCLRYVPPIRFTVMPTTWPVTSLAAPSIAPTEAPPTVLPMSSPPQMPIAPPTLQSPSPPVSPPIAPPTLPPTTPPVAPPNYPPTSPPIAPSLLPPTSSSMAPPTTLPLVSPILTPITSPSEPPVAPPTTPSTSQPVSPQTAPSTASPMLLTNSTPTSPVGSAMGGGITLVDAGERTTVAAIANAFETRTSGFGCALDGSTAANTRDGDISTRWSCKDDHLDDNCEIMYTFEEPQDIVRVLIAFYKGEDRTRELKIKLNGSSRSVIQSSGETDGFEDFELNANEAETLTLESLGLRGDKWISITEVQFMVQ